MQKKVIKTELNLLGQAKDLIGDLNDAHDQIKTAGKQFEKYQNDLQMAGNYALDLFDDAKKLMGKIEKAYKDLGVNPRTSNEYKRLESLSNDIITFRKRYSFKSNAKESN